MDSAQFDKLTETYIRRRDKTLKSLAEAARNVVPVLKDHHLSNTAQELERLLFEHDANEQEMRDAIAENPDAFVQALLLRMGDAPH